jgi:hypothetical protein
VLYEELNSKSIRELERMNPEASDGSQRRQAIGRILQAKKERRQNVRTWAFFTIGTVVALLGTVVKFLH